MNWNEGEDKKENYANEQEKKWVEETSTTGLQILTSMVGPSEAAWKKKHINSQRDVN